MANGTQGGRAWQNAGAGWRFGGDGCSGAGYGGGHGRVGRCPLEAELQELRKRVRDLEAALQVRRPATGEPRFAPASGTAPGRTLGRVKFFLPDRGFGFLAGNNGGRDTFFHASGIAGRRGRWRNMIAEGELLEFLLVQGRRGPMAREITWPGGSPLVRRQRKRPRRGSRRSSLGSAATDSSSGEISVAEDRSIVTVSPVSTASGGPEIERHADQGLGSRKAGERQVSAALLSVERSVAPPEEVILAPVLAVEPAPVEEPASNVEQAPAQAVEPSQVVEPVVSSVPAVEPAPAVEVAPVVEPVPVAKPAPVVEQVVERAAAVEIAPVIRTAPDVKPVVEPPSTVERAPVVEEGPDGERAPADKPALAEEPVIAPIGVPAEEPETEPVGAPAVEPETVSVGAPAEEPETAPVEVPAKKSVPAGERLSGTPAKGTAGEQAAVEPVKVDVKKPRRMTYGEKDEHRRMVISFYQRNEEEELNKIVPPYVAKHALTFRRHHHKLVWDYECEEVTKGEITDRMQEGVAMAQKVDIAMCAWRDVEEVDTPPAVAQKALREVINDEVMGFNFFLNQLAKTLRAA